MKDLQSYLYPVFAVVVIVGCDYVFCNLNYEPNSKLHVLDYIMIVIYNYFALMSLLTLLVARFANPGFIPLNY